MGVSPVDAGPLSTAPVAALNCEPWHGQTMTAAVWSYPTVQPACGHTASKAANFPALAWITIEGSPVRGSANDAAPPTGTSLAGPIAVPAGWPPPDPLVVGPAWGAEAEGGEAGNEVPELLSFVPPTSRPRPATTPPRTRPAAAAMAVTVPFSTTSRRLASSALTCREPRRARARAAIAASADHSGPAPASSNGVHANTKTMSAPV